MKIIVTGGAGFIGSHLTHRLITEGHQVMILDDFSAGNKDFVHHEARVEEVNILDWPKVAKAFTDFAPEAVFHLAAQISLRSKFTDAKRYATDSMNILKYAQLAGVKRFIFSSTAAVYGDNNNLPIKETEPYAPASAYGVSKMNFEQHLLGEHREKALQTVVLRYANVYGPRQGTVGEGGVVAIFCKKLLANEPLTIFGTGEQTRDFTFVDDVVESNVLALQSNEDGMVYNVSTSQETSVNELAQLLLQISGKNVEIKYTAPAAGDVLRSCLDNSLIKQELGWAPRISIDEGLKNTWTWFKDNY